MYKTIRKIHVQFDELIESISLDELISNAKLQERLRVIQELFSIESMEACHA